MKKRVILIVLMLVLVLSLVTACELLQPAPQHQHTFEETWTSDEASHYHEATCEHFDLTKDKASHTFGTDGRCTVCGYQPIPSNSNNHIWENGMCTICGQACAHENSVVWEHTETSHKRYCTSCNLVLQQGAHIFGQGEQSNTCTQCDYVKSPTTQPDHNHVWVEGACNVCKEICSHEKLEWKQTESAHTQYCSTCELVLQQNDHSFGESDYVNGQIVTTCQTCDYKHCVADTHQHEYQEGVCAICKQACTHTDGQLVWAKDEASHKQYYNCCDKVAQQGAHSFSSYVVTTKPTYDEFGEQKATCFSCHYEKTQQIAKITAQDIIREVAYAYYRQANQIQYDQIQFRRDLINSPEDATSQDGMILDCSSYVNSVYQEAFGVNVMPNSDAPKTEGFSSYAKNNAKNVDVIGYWETANYTTEAKQKELMSSIKSQLQIGDVFTYRKGTTEESSGHVLIYVGNNYFLHSTGTDYQYNDDPTTSYDKATAKESTDGSIQLMLADYIFTRKDNNPKLYMFYDEGSTKVLNFCLLRPLNRGLTPTNQSKARMTMPGLDIEKSVSVGQYGAIYNGSNVTYTLTLKNTSNVALTNVTFAETLGAYSTFVSSSKITADGKKLTWTGNISANATVTLTYVVKVQTSVKGAKVVSESTVNGVKTNTLNNTVSLYTESQMQSLVTLAKSYASSSKTFGNPITMAKTLYKEALGVELFTYTTVSSTLNDLIDKTNLTCYTSTDVSKMLAPGLYGGMNIKTGYKTDSFRARLLKETNLAVGDIIICAYDAKSIVYVYIGDNTLVGIHSDDDVCFSVQIGNGKYTQSGSYYILGDVLTTMVSFDRYAVLRPSMVG